jgi:FkbM family methyltransferase
MKFIPTIASLLRKINTNISSNPVVYFSIKPFIHLSRYFHKKFANQMRNTPLQTIKNVMGNVKMTVNPSTYMGGQIYWCGFHQLSELIYLKEWLKPNMVVIDIGANQGEFSMLAGKILTHGEVISFEPVTEYFNLLSANKTLNNLENITCCQFGLSETNESLPIYTSLAETHQNNIHDGLSTLYKSDERDHLQEVIEIKILDEYLTTHSINRLDLIKIDIEGSELYALKGAKNTIATYKPNILIEVSVNNYANAGYTVEDLLLFLNPFGYEPFKIKRGKPVSIGINELTVEGDYLFVSKLR